ncbi:MAG: DNA alkylation repair protein, partial [Natronosporangium sp.]
STHRPPPAAGRELPTGSPYRRQQRGVDGMIGSMPQATPLADEIMDRLTRAYQAARDPDRAAPMAAYMRDQFQFLGIPGPAQKALTREVLAGLGRPTEADLAAVARACWRLPEREYQYFACAGCAGMPAAAAPGSSTPRGT